MLDQNAADRLEDKIDKLTDSLQRLREDFRAHGEKNTYVAKTVEDSQVAIRELQDNMNRGKGVLGFLTLLSIIVGAMASMVMFIKK